MHPTDLTAWIAARRDRCHEDDIAIRLPAKHFLRMIDLIEALAREVRERRDHAADNWFYCPRCRDLLSTTEAAIARLLENSHD